MKLKDLEFVFLDCQSTGASPAYGHLLEIAWTRSRATDELGQIHSYLLKQPQDNPIPHMIYAITGITQGEMQNAIEPAEACALLQRSFDQPDAVDHALIHYGRFEKAFLEDLYKRSSISSVPSDTARSDNQLPYKILCTYEIARRIFPNLPTRGIKGLAGFFGAPVTDVKRAACHVAATRLIWQGLIDELHKLGIDTIALLEEWIASAPIAKRTKLEYPLPKSKRTSLPTSPGVYRMLDRLGNVLYVGKATSLKSRVNSYFVGRSGKDARRLEMLTRVHDLQITTCDTILEAALLESDEIKRLNPPYNVVLKEGKRQLLYYNNELWKWSTQRNAEFPVGPFAGPFQMEPLIRLCASLQDGQFDENLFFEYIEPELLKEGYEIFEQALNVPKHYRKPREFLSFAIRHYRKIVREMLKDQQLKPNTDAAQPHLVSAAPNEDKYGPNESTNGPDEHNNGADTKTKAARTPLPPVLSDSKDDDGDDATSIEDLESLESLETPEETVLTAEDVAGKFERMFLRAAKAYLQAKTIDALSNSQIYFQDKHRSKTLVVQNGVVAAYNPSTETPKSKSPEQLSQCARVDTDDSDWSDTPRQSQIDHNCPDLLTFDRMRILLAELGRITRTGAPVQIKFKSGKKSSSRLIGFTPI